MMENGYSFSGLYRRVEDVLPFQSRTFDFVLGWDPILGEVELRPVPRSCPIPYGRGHFSRFLRKRKTGTAHGRYPRKYEKANRGMVAYPSAWDSD